MSGPTTIRVNADFGANIQAIADRIGARIERVAAKIVGELFSRIVERTPVDTGRLRGNWNPSLDTPNLTQMPSAGPGTNYSGSMKNRIEAMNIAGHLVYLSNGLPYAGVVEYGGYPNPPKGGAGKTVGGYSTQAPQGMVRVSMAEIESIMEEALK